MKVVCKFEPIINRAKRQRYSFERAQFLPSSSFGDNMMRFRLLGMKVLFDADLVSRMVIDGQEYRLDINNERELLLSLDGLNWA